MKKTILPSLFLVFLFNGNAKSQVIFNYDDAGNQIYRGTSTGTGRIASPSIKENPSTLADQISNQIQIAPNPVETYLNVFWKENIANSIVKIELLPYNSFTIIEYVNLENKKSNQYRFNMTNLPYGVYYLKFYLSDGSTIAKTITKN